MYRKCTTEKSTFQQRTFEHCMLKAMLEKEYDEISISSLCRDAGLSRKTFYRLFDSKADVIFSMVDHAFLDAHNFVPDPSIKPGGLHHFFAFWKSRKPLLDALSKHSCISFLMDRATAFITNEESDLLHCLGADQENGQEILLFTLNAIFALVISWYSSGYERSIDEMSELLMKLLTTPMVKSEDFDPYR